MVVGVRCIPRPERIEPSHDTNPSWFPTYSHWSAIPACVLLFILLWVLGLLELDSLLEKVGVTDGKALGLVLGDVDGTTVDAELGSLLGLNLGDTDGKALGLTLGNVEGVIVGTELGSMLGEVLGAALGSSLGLKEGDTDGITLGLPLGNVEGSELGSVLWHLLGSSLGSPLGLKMGLQIPNHLGLLELG